MSKSWVDELMLINQVSFHQRFDVLKIQYHTNRM
jgi:hypothetical protein